VGREIGGHGGVVGVDNDVSLGGGLYSYRSLRSRNDLG
jgi:hypothetical protein